MSNNYLSSPCDNKNQHTKVKINKLVECKIVNIFLSISFNICFGCSKEPSHVLGAQKNSH